MIYINREGEKFIFLKYLATQFDKINISGYEWSPDNQHIAFGLRVTPDKYPNLNVLATSSWRLAVMDIQTQNVTNYCLQVAPQMGEPIWSPDGKQLLVAVYHGGVYDPSDYNPSFDTVLVDIEKGYAALVAEYTYPLAWVIDDQAK